LISLRENIPCPTTVQLLLEYVSSQTTLLAIMNAEINNRCPEEPLAAGNRALSLERRNSAVNVTAECNRVRCRAYAMNWTRVGVAV